MVATRAVVARGMTGPMAAGTAHASRSASDILTTTCAAIARTAVLTAHAAGSFRVHSIHEIGG